MKVELWPLSQVKPYPNNPRINDDAVACWRALARRRSRHPPMQPPTGRSTRLCWHGAMAC